MAILRSKQLRQMEKKELEKKLSEMKLEIAKEKANISIGATTTSPGKIRVMRKTIARIETIMREPGAEGKGVSKK